MVGARTSLLVASLFCASLPAGAAIITYYGADNGAAPGGARPNADAAAASFSAALGAGTTINFESGTLASPVPGVTISLLGAAGGGFVGTDQHAPTPLGFNTTAAGHNWLQMLPAFSSGGESVTFTFATPIAGFGAFFTDTQETFPGPATISFNDGTDHTLNIVKNDNSGGVLFFGFTDFGASITQITIATGATGSSRDIWGIDDVSFRAAAPEPASLALLGLGLAALGLRRRPR